MLPCPVGRNVGEYNRKGRSLKWKEPETQDIHKIYQDILYTSLRNKLYNLSNLYKNESDFVKAAQHENCKLEHSDDFVRIEYSL